MALFRKRDEEDYEEEEERFLKEEEKADKKLTKKFRDLNPKNKRKRKEPPKPWGKKERFLVLIVFAVTIFVSFILTFSARGSEVFSSFRLSFPQVNFDSLNIFGEKTIIIEK